MKQRRVAFIILPPLALLVLVGILWTFVFKQKVIALALGQIPKVNSSQQLVKVQVAGLSFSLIKMQATVTNVEFEFLNAFSDFGTVKIDSVKIQVDPFRLLVGQISAAYVQLQSANGLLDEKAYARLFSGPDHAPGQLNLDPLFKVLSDLPVQNLYLSDTALNVLVPENVYHAVDEVRLRIGLLQLKNQKKLVSFTVTQASFSAHSNKNKIDSGVNFSGSGQFDARTVPELNLKIEKGRSLVDAMVETDDLKNILIHPRIRGSLKGSINLDEAWSLAHVIKKSAKRWPRLRGNIDFKSDLNVTSENQNEGSFSLAYKDVSVDALKVGNGAFTTQIKDNQLKIDSVKLEHPSGTAELKNISFQNTAPFNFKTDVELREFSLQKLFVSLNLNTIPVDLELTANASCTGKLTDLLVNCRGHIDAKNIWVDSDMKKSTNIVRVQKLSTDVEAEITTKEARFKSAVQLAHSSFNAEGKVNFAEGFEILCRSDLLELGDIENISQLGLKGAASGLLKTKGDSEAATIESELRVKKAAIDKFYLGDVKGKFAYEKGVIGFSRVEGVVNSSQYRGQISINLRDSATSGQFLFLPFNVIDGLSMIEDKWHLPIAATGIGKAAVDFSGPLDFWKMQMKIDAQLIKGSLYGESFTRLDALLNSDGEKLEFSEFKLHKPNGFVQLTNYINTEKTPLLNLNLSSKNILIEDVDHFAQFFKNANGNLTLSGSITGPLDRALIMTTAQVTNLEIGNHVLPSSQITSELSKEFFKGTGQLFGRQIQTDFTIPLSPQEKYAVKVKVKDFSPLILLPLIGLALPNYEMTAQLTGDVDLTSRGPTLDSLDGKIDVQQLSIVRGLQVLKLTAPSEFLFNSKLQSMTPLRLEGPDQNLTFRLKDNSGEKKFYSSGRLFLKPFQFLAPFTETLSGILEFNTDIQFTDQRIDLRGEGLINDASFSTKGFPYPISDISAFFDLNNTRINFSELAASLNQTNLTGGGFVDIKGPKNVQVEIKAESEELEIEFPSGIRTAGLAKVAFFGDWLPYTLKLDYMVTQGLMTKEFTGSEDSAKVLAPNPLLPEAQLKREAQGLLLDAQVNFNRGIIVKNSLLEGTLTGSIAARGSPDFPVLTGTVAVQPASRLIFKDKPFDIQNAVVKFNGGKEINPDISMAANARINEYDIALNIQGPAKKLNIEATSQPILDENDIFSLLALGYTSNSTDQTISSDIQTRQTGLEVLSAIGNQSQLSKKIQSRLGLNVQLAPSIDSTRNIAVPKVIVSKQLGKKLNTSYSRTLTGDRQNNEIKLQWLFRPDTSLILNYQNQPTIQENNILTNQAEEDIGVGGVDLEYKKEFE